MVIACHFVGQLRFIHAELPPLPYGMPWLAAQDVLFPFLPCKNPDGRHALTRGENSWSGLCPAAHTNKAPRLPAASYYTPVGQKSLVFIFRPVCSVDLPVAAFGFVLLSSLQSTSISFNTRPDSQPLPSTTSSPHRFPASCGATLSLRSAFRSNHPPPFTSHRLLLLLLLRAAASFSHLQMTSPKEARPPVKRALRKTPPPQVNHHVHSTKAKNQVELLAKPGSHAQPGEQSWCMSLAGQPLTTFSSLIPDSEAVHINTNAVPQPFLDASLLQKDS
ncbi:hypothetical protein PWT90_09220 [Aphanocladium album]|nr:hypothetical protein PWT90_09220 [Aphanocladium album]